MSIGARELVEIEHDLRAGEASCRQIAERSDVPTRAVERIRAAMRKRGERLRYVSDWMRPNGKRKTQWGVW